MASKLRTCILAAAAFASAHADPLDKTLVAARTHAITPRKQAPTIDWPRIQNAMAFQKAHGQTISTTLLTTSLVSTYACRDIEPVLAYTGELIDNYGDRMAKTGKLVDAIMKPTTSKSEFASHNFKEAYNLGLLHLDVAKGVPGKALGWNSKQRTVLNQQAFSFVFYSFAWQPIETMEALHEIDPVKDAKAINDWVYMWRVYGYGMGVPTKLLPTSAENAKNLATRLRALQYPKRGEHAPKAVETLLKNEVNFMCMMLDPKAPLNDTEKKKVEGLLAQFITTSPGLSEALGLGSSPLKGLSRIIPSTAPPGRTTNSGIGH